VLKVLINLEFQKIKISSVVDEIIEAITVELKFLNLQLS